MKWTRFHFLTQRLRPLAPVVVLALASALGAVFLSSCGVEPAAVRQQPLTVEGVPIIRIRLTASGVTGAEIATTGGYRLFVGGRAISESEGRLAPVDVTRSGQTWKFNNLTAAGERVKLQPSPGSYVRFGGITYRGELRLLPEGLEKFTVVNHVDMESYLAGVLPKELYPSWHGQAYRALATAARTFALVQMKRFGGSKAYDLGDGQASQVYGGFSAETDKSWAAVRDTHGQVLVYEQDGEEKLFLTQYSACCGGYVNGAYAIRKAPQIEPLLGGQECNDCRSCPRYRWPPVKIAKTHLIRVLAASYPSAEKLEDIQAVRVVSSALHGRAVWLDIVGPGGMSVRLRAEDLRLSLLRSGLAAARKLYSMNCKVRLVDNDVEFYDGRGFGHGVGLCQWGAQRKAETGWTDRKILNFYYPGSKLIRAY
ncbi:MAG: SpoIID/LytB domain-containing protein [Planctomycetota bacterium]|nr:SpoIID/LytB domain-containing protein [Planctomycetota bacterium]